MDIYYIFIFFFQLYILKFTNPNLIRFDLADYMYILSMFDNVNKTSKEKPIGKAIVSVKIGQFLELVFNPIIRLNILVSIKSINQR